MAYVYVQCACDGNPSLADLKWSLANLLRDTNQIMAIADATPLPHEVLGLMEINLRKCFQIMLLLCHALCTKDLILLKN